jgi:hypothetical protein
VDYRLHPLEERPPAEMVRRVATSVLEHSDHAVEDDNALLLVSYARQ